jgi:hypothetical protein
MISFKIKDQGVFARIEKSVIADVESIMASRPMMEEVGEFTVSRLKYQMRVSKPYNSSGTTKDLEDSTIRNRKYLEKFNDTAETYSPERSNLTFTGQLLDSMKYIIKGVGLLEVLFDGMHRGYLSGTGRRGKNLSNSTLYGYLVDKDKRFAVFDNSLNDNGTFKARVKSIVLRYVRRGLAVRNRIRS